MRVDVTSESREYRAPTDESVKLLREMEEAARAKVLHSYNVGGNVFNGVLIEIRDICAMRKLYQYEFNLNGHVYSGEIAISEKEIAFDRIEEKVFEKLSQEIALRLMAVARRK